MSAVLTSPSAPGDLVKREFDRDYNRETVTLKAGNYAQGAVLGRITASGLYALSPAASTAALAGAEVACAVLLNATTATADTVAVVLVRGPVILADKALAFDASVADLAARSAKHQQLAAHGLVVRQAV